MLSSPTHRSTQRLCTRPSSPHFPTLFLLGPQRPATDCEFMYILASGHFSLQSGWSGKLPEALLIERISPHHCLSGPLWKRLLRSCSPYLACLTHPQTRPEFFSSLKWLPWVRAKRKVLVQQMLVMWRSRALCSILLTCAHQVYLGFFQNEQFPL